MTLTTGVMMLKKSALITGVNDILNLNVIIVN